MTRAARSLMQRADHANMIPRSASALVGHAAVRAGPNVHVGYNDKNTEFTGLKTCIFKSRRDCGMTSPKRSGHSIKLMALRSDVCRSSF